MNNDSPVKRSESFKNRREEIESLDHSELSTDSSGYSYRHLDRNEIKESKKTQKLTIQDVESNPIKDATLQEKYKSVRHNRWSVLITILCTLVIIGVAIILYFFVFKDLML